MKKIIIAIIIGIFLLNCDEKSGTNWLDFVDSVETNKVFSTKGKIIIETVSGDCNIGISKDDSIRILLEYFFEPAEVFSAQFSEESNSLRIRELFNGSAQGYSEWTINVPKNTDISFYTASGNFVLDSIDGEISVATASGNVILNNPAGEFEINTASGDIDAHTILFTGKSSFNSASGNIYVQLIQSSEEDINLSSASGNVVLDYSGNEIIGFFEFIALVNNGEIISPFQFDSEETFQEHGNTYYRKSFTRIGNSPRIYLRTASGTAELK